MFVDPLAAVAAALDTQHGAEPRLPDLPVRMSLHTGDAMLRNADNYVGLTIIRCARIRSCGSGGQLLVSADTAPQVGTALDPRSACSILACTGSAVSMVAIGSGSSAGPNLPVAFAPFNAGTSATGNLPATISSFVGRRTELASLGEASPPSPGDDMAGGRRGRQAEFAIASAGAAADSMPGGVWWVALSEWPTMTSTRCRRHVACLFAGASGVADPVDAIVDHFDCSSTRLVVDGYDQAREAAARWPTVVDPLLDLRLQTTGHHPLRLPGEMVHELAPMTLPPEVGGTPADLARFDAARLFIERAISANPGNDFTDEHVADIGRICRELGGLPLGIELAAARSGSSSISDLAASLSSLTGSGEAGTGAFDALASSIAWSYQALSEHGQAALRRLAVFHGGFEIDAAAAVAIGGELDESAAMAAMRALLDQQLLGVDETSGRLTLAPSIREFAHERLAASTDAARATARHGIWFAELAEQFGAAGLANPASLLVPDKLDVLGALETSMASDDVSVAYRILIGLGAWWHLLDQADTVDAAAHWICGRSPSDGEERWAAAVARLSYALAAKPGAPVHEFADEARAIAELTGDRISPRYVGLRPGGEGGARWRPCLGRVVVGGGTLRWCRGGGDRDRAVVGLRTRPRRPPDRSESVQLAVLSLLGGGTYEGPIDASRVDIDDAATDGTVLDDMAPGT